jgi:hypothetical protein
MSGRWPPPCPCAVFSTRTNRLEVNLDRVEEEQGKMAALRREAGNNPLKRIRLLLAHRAMFLWTPLSLWLFLALLGVLSAAVL